MILSISLKSVELNQILTAIGFVFEMNHICTLQNWEMKNKMQIKAKLQIPQFHPLLLTSSPFHIMVVIYYYSELGLVCQKPSTYSINCGFMA